MAETILKLTTVNSQSMQRLAYNILALVMKAHEKQAYLCDDYRTQLIDTLKALLQHDQIKEEFIKQDG
ncbi:unnamed protein product [Rotaria magnacalcarata]|uniref:Uncharacterized protein n=1 Tax=Rotaria magnacalcarata TaxID=392030 RepID=A0A815GSS8_9BILA|nr:unnamed protein product [Rotaria magnacalcarata]